MFLFHKSGYDWLIVGLGNPGKQYESSRHNSGFLALDLLADMLHTTVTRSRFQGLTGSAEYEGQKLLLLKPQTFMNASGLSVEPAAHFYRIPAERILILSDDISLPVGKIRVRANGSAGGHNGLKSVISALGSDRFPRIKIGVGAKPHPDYDLADWVLSSVSREDLPAFRKALENAANAALVAVSSGTDRASAAYNGK